MGVIHVANHLATIEERELLKDLRSAKGVKIISSKIEKV